MNILFTVTVVIVIVYFCWSNQFVIKDYFYFYKQKGIKAFVVYLLLPI